MDGIVKIKAYIKSKWSDIKIIDATNKIDEKNYRSYSDLAVKNPKAIVIAFLDKSSPILRLIGGKYHLIHGEDFTYMDEPDMGMIDNLINKKVILCYRCEKSGNMVKCQHCNIDTCDVCINKILRNMTIYNCKKCKKDNAITTIMTGNDVKSAK